MEDLQNLIKEMLKQIPRLALEKQLGRKMREAGLPIDKAILSKATEHILSESRESFIIDGDGDTRHPDHG